MKRLFEFKDYNAEMRFKVATLKLSKLACVWYEGLARQKMNLDIVGV